MVNTTLWTLQVKITVLSVMATIERRIFQVIIATNVRNFMKSNNEHICNNCGRKYLSWQKKGNSYFFGRFCSTKCAVAIKLKEKKRVG
jgi:hypothetical protein